MCKNLIFPPRLFSTPNNSEGLSAFHIWGVRSPGWQEIGFDENSLNSLKVWSKIVCEMAHTHRSASSLHVLSHRRATGWGATSGGDSRWTASGGSIWGTSVTSYLGGWSGEPGPSIAAQKRVSLRSTFLIYFFWVNERCTILPVEHSVVRSSPKLCLKSLCTAGGCRGGTPERAPWQSSLWEEATGWPGPEKLGKL